MIEIAVLKKTTVTVDSIRITVPVRYEDEDMPFDFPFRENDMWTVIVDLETGRIKDWPDGNALEMHMKVVDEGMYELLNGDAVVAVREDNYVPGFLPEDHFGDYLIFDIDKTGLITNWHKPSSQNLQDAFSLNDDE